MILTNRLSFKVRIALFKVCLAGLSSISGQSQTTNQFVYHNSDTAALPGNLSSTPNLLFSSPNALFDFENLLAPTVPTVYVQKGAGQDGIHILDNNPNDSTALHHSLNIELYNITTLPANAFRAGIQVHVDATNTVLPPLPTPPPNFANLNGIEIGNHGAYTTGLYVETQGAATSSDTYATKGVGIISTSWGLGNFLLAEGDPNHNTLSTEGVHFNHYTQGNILSLNQASSTMSGDFIYANAQYDGSGSLTGNFLNFQVTGAPKFTVDSSGNVTTNSGKVTIPAIKANTGTRFVCVDTSGTLISQTTPCSGT
jgi:hypothetical protein